MVMSWGARHPNATVVRNRSGKPLIRTRRKKTHPNRLFGNYWKNIRREFDPCKHSKRKRDGAGCQMCHREKSTTKRCALWTALHGGANVGLLAQSTWRDWPISTISPHETVGLPATHPSQGAVENEGDQYKGKGSHIAYTAAPSRAGRMSVVGALTGAGLGYPSSLFDGPRRVDVVGPDHHQLRHVHGSQRLCVTVDTTRPSGPPQGGKNASEMRKGRVDLLHSW